MENEHVLDNILAKQGTCEDCGKSSDTDALLCDECHDKIDSKLTKIVGKEWMPFYGPRGSIGVYDTDNPENRRYGHDAESRLNSQNGGGRQEQFIDFNDTITALQTGAMSLQDLDEPELKALYGFLKSGVGEQSGDSKVKYEKLLDDIEHYMDTGVAKSQADLLIRLKSVIGSNEN